MSSGRGSQPMQPGGRCKAVCEFAGQVFETLLVAYLILVLGDTIWENSISEEFNLDWLMAIVVFTGVLSSPVAPLRRSRFGLKVAYWQVVLLGVIAGLAGIIVVWLETRDTGWFSVVFALAGGLLIWALISRLLGDGDEEFDSQDR